MSKKIQEKRHKNDKNTKENGRENRQEISQK